MIVLGSIIGMLCGWAVAALIIWLVWGLPRKRRNSKPSERFDVDPSRFITEDPYARHEAYMPPEMLADLRARHDPAKTCIRNLDGVSWHDLPAPPRRHRCWVQTWGTINWFTDVYRCPCGAVNRGDGWFERNSRKVEPGG